MGTKYKLFNKDGIEIILHNTEDKNWWLKYGNRKEEAFIKFAEEKGILYGIRLNPDASPRPWLPEFTYQGRDADLKEQTTPFFSAGRYGLDPRFSFTLNKRDVQDINEKYPNCLLIIYINWIAVKYQKLVGNSIVQEILVDPLQGVWLLHPSSLKEIIRNAPLHSYAKRKDDKSGNAKASYIIDVRSLENIWINKNS